MRAIISRAIAIWSAISLAVAVGLSTAPAVAYADAMPSGHEPFAENSSICVLCHRTHTATNLNLLRADAGLCLSCHKNGAGADTDVAGGKYVVSSDSRPVPPNSPRHGSPMGQVNGNLLGGGFAQLDTDGDGSTETQAYPGTSQHKVGTTIVPFGSDSGASAILECDSCHTIHKTDFTGQYRYLRAQVGDKTGLQVTWNGPWEGPNQQQPRTPDGPYRAYTETGFGTGLTYDPLSDSLGGEPVEYTRNYRTGLSAWCTGCHSVYGTKVGPYDIDNGEGSMERHKHVVDVTLTNTGRLTDAPDTNLPLSDPDGIPHDGDEMINCLTCHKAHGTTADASQMATAQAASRGVLPLINTSMLLRLDNRGVCIDCHWYLKGLGS